MDTKAIGENVKFYRRLRKLTQRELAKKTHMTQQNVVLIEKGSTMPPPDTLEALSDALDVPLPDLYCDGESYHISFDFTPYYVDRMSHEAEEVQEVMRRALKECKNEMTITLKLSRSEMDSFRALNGEKRDPVKFWSFIDEYGLQSALDTPSDYVWCLNKLKEYNGDKKRVSEAWADKMMKKTCLKVTVGFPHNVNRPWLCSKDWLKYWSLIGFNIILKK